MDEGVIIPHGGLSGRLGGHFVRSVGHWSEVRERGIPAIATARIAGMGSSEAVNVAVLNQVTRRRFSGNRVEIT